MTDNEWAPGFHIYVLRSGRLLHLSSTTKDGIGTALVQHHEDGEFSDGEAPGVLHREEDQATGTWIVNPYALGLGRG